MEPTTVKITDQGETLTWLNCGFIQRRATSTVIDIGGHSMTIRGTLTNPLEAAQRFADLLTDVTE